MLARKLIYHLPYHVFTITSEILFFEYGNSTGGNIARGIVDMSLTLSVHVGRCYTPLWEILDTPLTLTSFHKLKVDQTQPKSAFKCRKIFFRAFNLSQTKLRKGNILTPVCQSVDRDGRCIPPWTHTAWADTPWTHAPAPWTNTPRRWPLQWNALFFHKDVSFCPRGGGGFSV